jgi:hypothetical protein
MDEKPEALRLADQMLHYWDERGPDAEKVAAELRRLHEVNGELLEALMAIAEGCSFPADDVQRAIRDRARTAIAKAEGK